MLDTTLFSAILGAVLVTVAPFQRDVKTDIFMMTVGILIVLIVIARTS